jgi:hypothetical protein
MERLCERPGCSQVAEFLYAIDAEHLTVWLEPFESGGSDRAGVLCRRHADAMVVPLGWMLDDRRAQAPQLFRTLSSPSAPPNSDRSRRQRAGTPAAVEALQLSLDAAEESDARAAFAAPATTEPAVTGPAASESAVTAPDEQVDVAVDVDVDIVVDVDVDDLDPTAALPWRPVFDQSDDLDGLLTASSPLLRRAFGRNPPP